MYASHYHNTAKDVAMLLTCCHRPQSWAKLSELKKRIFLAPYPSPPPPPPTKFIRVEQVNVPTPLTQILSPSFFSCPPPMTQVLLQTQKLKCVDWQKKQDYHQQNVRNKHRKNVFYYTNNNPLPPPPPHSPTPSSVAVFLIFHKMWLRQQCMASTTNTGQTVSYQYPIPTFSPCKTDRSIKMSNNIHQSYFTEWKQKWWCFFWNINGIKAYLKIFVLPQDCNCEGWHSRPDFL